MQFHAIFQNNLRSAFSIENIRLLIKSIQYRTFSYKFIKFISYICIFIVYIVYFSLIIVYVSLYTIYCIRYTICDIFVYRIHYSNLFDVPFKLTYSARNPSRIIYQSAKSSLFRNSFFISP